MQISLAARPDLDWYLHNLESFHAPIKKYKGDESYASEAANNVDEIFPIDFDENVAPSFIEKNGCWVSFF